MVARIVARILGGSYEDFTRIVARISINMLIGFYYDFMICTMMYQDCSYDFSRMLLRFTMIVVPFYL